MRKEYIEQIQTFLRDTPNFTERMEEMRLKALISGATEEEFDEAVKQLAPDDAVVLPKKLRPFTKKLVAIDVVVHVLFIVSAIGSISLVASLMTSDTFPKLLSLADRQKTVTRLPQNGAGEEFLPQVYANSTTLNGARVFSFPGSNVTLEITGTPRREVFGFLPYWMIDQEEKINFVGLTTISFFGLEMDGGGNIITQYENGEADQGWVMWNSQKMDEAVARAKRQRIKTQITLKAFNNENIEKLVASDEAQETFIANAIYLVNTRALDGVTLDFEYVGTPDKNVTDGFTRFVTNLYTELKRQVPSATVSVATYVGAGREPGLFDIELLAPNVTDFVVMGYDFNTPEGDPGPIAPMDGTVSLKSYIQGYLGKVSADKLILALPQYGYDWPIDIENKRVGNAGMLSYAEVASLSNAYQIYWDRVAQTPFFQYVDPETSQSRVVHFENARSLGIKYDYINEMNLKGVGIWALGYDGLNNDLRSLLLEKFTK